MKQRRLPLHLRLLHLPSLLRQLHLPALLLHLPSQAYRTHRAAASASTKSTGPQAIPVVDVVKKMEELAAKNPAKLDWKVSIVDLLKLLDIDSSFEARKELATELGCPADLMGDSAKMNVWLHKTVLKKIAENGGNIPQALLD